MLDPILIASDTNPQEAGFGVRRKISFDFGRPLPLDRFQKQLCLAFCEALQRLKLLSASHFAVFRSLLNDFHNSRSGLCFPSFEALAEKSGVSRRTVARSVVLFERFGLLTWTRRLRRVRVAGVVVPVRASNSYVFIVPASVEAISGLVARLAASAARAAAAFVRSIPRVFSHLASRFEASTSFGGLFSMSSDRSAVVPPSGSVVPLALRRVSVVPAVLERPSASPVPCVAGCSLSSPGPFRPPVPPPGAPVPRPVPLPSPLPACPSSDALGSAQGVASRPASSSSLDLALSRFVAAVAARRGSSSDA